MPATHSVPQIIQAKSEHAEQISPLFDVYRQFYRQIPDPQGALQFITERLAHQDSIIFLAVLPDLGAVGFTQLYPSFSSVSMQRLFILNDLYVADTARRRGVAQALLQRAVAYAREHNAKGLTLQTGHDNRQAQSLYESRGWKRDTQFFSYMLLV